jgi:putative membrane protein
MSPVAQVAAVVAAVLHVLFFLMESVLFSRPQVYARFGVTSERDARAIRPMAFNQGFYNLFLALGAVGGVVLADTGHAAAGCAVTAFACACMVLAGVVLLITDRKFLQAALIQAVPPLVAVIAIAAQA